MTIDHKIRKQDGGKGVPDNGQLAHPYCNSTFKEQRVHHERKEQSNEAFISSDDIDLDSD